MADQKILLEVSATEAFVFEEEYQKRVAHVGFGAHRNFGKINRHRSDLKNALRLFLDGHTKNEGMIKCVWATVLQLQQRGDASLLHWNNNRGRYYLITGLYEYCQLLCVLIERERAQLKQPDEPNTNL